MRARKLAGALAAVAVFGSGLAVGKAWAQAGANAAALTLGHQRLLALDEEVAALQRRLDRHAESQRQLAEQAEDCRIATAYWHAGRRPELALKP